MILSLRIKRKGVRKVQGLVKHSASPLCPSIFPDPYHPIPTMSSVMLLYVHTLCPMVCLCVPYGSCGLQHPIPHTVDGLTQLAPMNLYPTQSIHTLHIVPYITNPLYALMVWRCRRYVHIAQINPMTSGDDTPYVILYCMAYTTLIIGINVKYALHQSIANSRYLVDSDDL